MDQLSQALNLGPQPMPPAYSRLHGPTLKSISRKNRLYLYGVDTLAEFSGTARGASGTYRGRSRLYGGGSAAAPANQIHTVTRLPFLSFACKTASIVRKIYFIVRNGQSRTKNKPKTKVRREWLHSDYMINWLANKKLYVVSLAIGDATGGQRDLHSSIARRMV